MYTPIKFFTNEMIKNVSNTVKEVSSFIYPPVTLYQDSSDLVLEAEMAGFDKKNIKVSVNKNVLTISAERKREYSTVYIDQRVDKVYKVVKLPVEIEQQDISAKYSEGILTVRMKTKNIKNVEIE
ncbi:class I small heat shock protein [Thermoplasma volcanium GSS1]|uniref:Small heat shock protein n=1 Tax=Thermoplasma volcanium (strain ATCC 51530 / DSM 4299 / JCM 9571 / NBRC 15438 / GSS1) TaxID=273116 RepID=Q97AM1_THEVO|nr:archaeal heat shock protein Hsp14 [Thermoplasma volcanium]BAB59931.1 class I small heat shock protein [Thermoplasma volcanium GSS1]CBY78065.1 small heat shock protein [Thermoplasma volcanium GSS1]